MLKTPFFQYHVRLGGKMVPFSGWDMPLHYGSQLKEHHAVREDCGLFDVSHMGIIDLKGPGVEALLRAILCNNIDRIPHIGQSQYSLMLTSQGNVADDLLVYRLGENFFAVVVNAGTRDKDLAWIRVHAATFGVEVTERRDLAMLAVQGPNSVQKLKSFLPDVLWSRVQELKPFHVLADEDWRIARTGYTGEDGFELMVPNEGAGLVWDGLLRAEISPAGLGCRDTLRLEAGFSLYGHDMDEQTNPLESGLGWTVAWNPPERDFIGRKALELLRQEPALRKRVGILLTAKGVLRDHQKVFQNGVPVGDVTSGGYSPTLEAGIALAQVQPWVRFGDSCAVEVRGRLLDAKVVRPPFVRLGKPAFSLEPTA